MKTAHYGIDAPGLVRFFFIVGAVALACALVCEFTHILGATTKTVLSVSFGCIAAYLLGMGTLMIYSSNVMKLKDNEKLLAVVNWAGTEQVLDIGCGRGLMLVTAAKRLTTGEATGVDLWQQSDQANNTSSATTTNAELEGVSDRVTVQTADMRELPFPDRQFDIVTSNWAVHNLEAESDRQIALNEIIRVLKPGGVVLLNDIVNQSEYAKYLSDKGMKDVQIHSNGIRDTILRAITFGSFAPSAVSATKAV